MYYSATSKEIELRGSWLCAMAMKEDSSWTFSELNLNEYIGNDDGKFVVPGRGWFDSANRLSCRIDGSFLVAQLENTAGHCGEKQYISLDLYVENNQGVLKFCHLSESIMLSAFQYTLSDTVFKALLFDANGKAVYSSIDLNEYYGNIRGEFESGEKNYSWTGQNFSLEITSNAVSLVGELQDGNHVYRHAKVDINTCIVNQRGELAFVKHDGWFGRDHWATQFAEKIPVIGYAVAGLHLWAGNEDHFWRAVAQCTNSTIVAAGMVIGAAVGTLFASPHIGIVIGAGLASPIGIFAETTIANANIQDPHVRGQVQEATLERYFFETLRNMFAAGVASTAAGVVKNTLGPWIDKYTSQLLAWMGKKGIHILSEISIYSIMKKVIDRLDGAACEMSDMIRSKCYEIEELTRRTLANIQTMKLHGEQSTRSNEHLQDKQYTRNEQLLIKLVSGQDSGIEPIVL